MRTHTMSLPWFSRLRLLIVGMLLILLPGCGGKGSTKLSYTPPGSPLGISFSIDKDGSWTVAAGLATPIGTFAIEHTFISRDEFTYIVLRNREKGTDQVFKIGATGYVDLHAIGEHKIRMQREGNRWIIDTQTITGTLEVKVYPSDSAIARVDFGTSAPDMLLTSERKLIIEYPYRSTPSTTIPLDSVQSITLYQRILSNSKWVSFDWKKGVQENSMDVGFTGSEEALSSFDTLEKAVAALGLNIRFKKETIYFTSIVIFVVLWSSAILGGVVGYRVGTKAGCMQCVVAVIVIIVFDIYAAIGWVDEFPAFIVPGVAALAFFVGVIRKKVFR